MSHKGIALTAFVILLDGTACDDLAVKFAPKKTAKLSATELSKKAHAYFLDSLSAGSYENLPEAMRLLTAAYLQNPRDGSIAFHLGMAHLWKVAERSREPVRDPTITDHLILADKYLSEAHRLDPSDARIPGFEGSVKMALGSLHQDEALKRRGYFILKDGMKAYPEFNFFTMSFVLSNAPRTDPKFADAIDYAWKNVDLCVGHPVGRTASDAKRLAADFPSVIAAGSKDRACQNPPSAPHNMEGFFLHMGDILVKKGDVETGREIYALAKAAPTYSSWPYGNVLDTRIDQAGARAQAFASGVQPPPELMFQSRYACTGCHQTRAASRL
jgi:hypothetical protein